MTAFQFPSACSQGECHVYLIEDDEALRGQLVETLQDVGLVVHDFDRAESFLDAGVDHSPAVIISDMVLPGLSGIRLFESVRALGVETPLIFISGYSEPNQIIDGMKLGAVDFLWKPFKTDALLNAVCKSLTLDVQRHVHLEKATDINQRWLLLSDREREICRLMLKGFGNKDVSAMLGIQPDTANKHRMKVLKKMGVAGRPQLIELLGAFEPAQSGPPV